MPASPTDPDLSAPADSLPFACNWNTFYSCFFSSSVSLLRKPTRHLIPINALSFTNSCKLLDSLGWELSFGEGGGRKVLLCLEQDTNSSHTPGPLFNSAPSPLPSVFLWMPSDECLVILFEFLHCKTSYKKKIRQRLTKFC